MTDKPKTGKDAKPKLSMRRVLSNNFFMLKLLHKASPGRLLIESALWAVEALIGFFSWEYMLRIIVNGIEMEKGFADLWPLIAGMSTLNIVLVIVQNIWYHIYYALYYQRTTAYFQKLVYQKAARMELSSYENPEFYDKYIKALNETGDRADKVASSISMLIFTTVSMTANGILLFSIEPVFLLFLLIPIASTIFVRAQKQAGYNEYHEKIAMERRCDYVKRIFYLGEYASEMRLTGMYRVMAKRFGLAIRDTKAVIKKYGFRVATFGYLIEIMNEVLTFLGSTAYAVYRTLVTGDLLYGDCLVMINSMTTLTWRIQTSAETIFSFRENALYIENLRFFLEYAPKIADIPDAKMPCRGVLELQNVSFRYDGAEKDTLKNIHIRCGPNEKIALVGHNGAGKSTLVKLLLRLYDPTEGEILLDGENIRHLQLNAYRDAFSVVFQDFHVFSLPVMENVLLRSRRGGKEDVALVEKALQKSGVYDRVMKMNAGLETVLTREFDEHGVVLSGGETQKIAIAHTFTKDNLFVILDEPTSALDPIAEYEMYQNMTEACENCGMIFISHRLSSAVIADRIYLLDNGEVVEEGTHDELMRKNGKYAEMFYMQAENYADTEVKT